jgi:aspartate beta-hydroxylase
VEHLQAHWTTIRDEYKQVAPQRPSDYEDAATEHKLHQGTWDWHSYMLKGQLQGDFCVHFPQTTEILQALRDEGLLFEGTPFGFSFFSTLHPQSKIAPHTSPMNFRLRVHLPLLVPDENGNDKNDGSTTGRPACGIQVGPLVRPWKAGQALVLDDAYRHEVWNETEQARVVLLVDLWHPDVTVTERREIVTLLAQAAANNHKQRSP